MRLWFAVSVWVLYLCPPSALPQNIFSVPIVDKSRAGTPFQVNGKITLRESTRGNELEWSWGEKVVVENLSDKAVLLFVATIAEIGRHSALVGRHAAPGNGPAYRLEDDRFFAEKLVEPGASLLLRDTKPGFPDLACCIDGLAEAHDPSGEYRLLFVQFADGSIFGDPTEARASLAIREIIVRGLQELLQSYDQAGEPGFVARLSNLRSYLIDPSLAPKVEEQPPFFATSICRAIITQYDSVGTKAALDKARGILKIAEKHAAMISR